MNCGISGSNYIREWGTGDFRGQSSRLCVSELATNGIDCGEIASQCGGRRGAAPRITQFSRGVHIVYVVYAAIARLKDII